MPRHHLFLRCARAQIAWTALGLLSKATTPLYQVEEGLWSFALPVSPAIFDSVVIAAVLWNLWKCGNAKAFRQENESNFQVLRRCADDLLLWPHRCRNVGYKQQINLG